MIVTRENEKLYANSWQLNSARVLTELAKKVIANGGRVKPIHSAQLINRSIMECKEKLERDVQRLNDRIKNNNDDKLLAVLNRYKQQLDDLNDWDNEPVQVTHTSYISFVINDYYYYYQIDDNPFFDCLYQKIKIRNGERSQDSYLTPDNEPWQVEKFLKWEVTEKDISAAADKLYEFLLNVNETEIHKERERKRVYNLYNNGYHYETVVKPERKTKIDF